MKCEEQIQSNQTRIQYNGIDIIKFFCSIMVVMIHIAPFGTNSKYALLNDWIQNCIARIAVPFFFAASGFFLYKKTTYESFNITPSKGYVLKIFRIYIIWTVIYIPLIIKAILENPKGIVHGTLICIRNFLFIGSYVHLWYLRASIVGVVLISFLLYKKCKLKNIIGISIFFYALGLLAQSWFGMLKPVHTYLPHIWTLLKLLEKVIETTRNGLFEGFLFVGIGMLFAFSKIEINRKKAVTGFAVSYLLLLAEAGFVKHIHFIRESDMYIFLVPTTFFLFYIAQSISLKDNKVYLILRQLSSLIFYLHLWVEPVVSKFFLALFDINIGETCLKFIITLAVTTAAALAVIQLSKYKHFRWLKSLYA